MRATERGPQRVALAWLESIPTARAAPRVLRGGRWASVPAMRCPCDSGADHAACCGRFLDGHQRPATPEELMRSRYSAYVRGDVDYLLRTHAEETRPERRSLERSVEGATFVKLVVEEADGDHVTFAAHYLEGGVERVLRERSRFVRREGQWLYVDGEVTTTTVPLARAAEAVGRNAPCPCGSGKKYKRCHGG